ncbi:hypothetical protein BC938DRAFT_473515 [Jimgerdemannia flammicorona]|uniref:Uncharacterized protein n=1 Tax=Jimgerdemannia flammicorona TaxID=994334 RepID=A0A433QTB8_9FUNG|nr:hypothetical protein BC938DRAFT_473515 [Jimgerdemannia flammicorona]
MSDEIPSTAPSTDLTQPNGNFIFANQDMYEVQKYAIYGSTILPATDSNFKTTFGITDDEWTEDPSSIMHNLQRTYANISTHCGDFQNNTMNNIAGVAGIVTNHGDMVQGFYKEIIASAQKLAAMDVIPPEGSTDPVLTPEERKEQKLGLTREILGFVKAQILLVEPEAAKVAECVKEITEFRTKTQTDGGEVSEQKPKVTARFGDEKKILADFKKDSETLTVEINKAQREYDNYCIVAEVTPIMSGSQPQVTHLSINSTKYISVLVPIFGWIAGPIMAGIYGDKAVKALKSRNELQKKLSEKMAAKKKSLHFVSVYELIDTQVGDLDTRITKVLRCLEIIQGAWDKLKTDLEAIKNLLEDDLKPAAARAWSTKLELEMKLWADVAERARSYQRVAFISTPTVEEYMANPSKFESTTNQ